MTVIDVHTHVIPEAVLAWLESEEGPSDIRLEADGRGKRAISHDNGLTYEIPAAFTDASAKLRQMDDFGIDKSVVSIAPELFGYHLPVERGVAASQMMNEALADFVSGSNGRLHAVATLPMASPSRAVLELQRATRELGLVGAELGTSVGGRYLDHPQFESFLETADALGITLMLHPYLFMTGTAPDELSGYHLANVIGNPLETCIAAARLIAAGVFDRHPGLLVQLAHGGGFFPYQLGRMEHAYYTHDAARADAREGPRNYLRHFLFDTVLFDPQAVQFLLAVAGADNVVFGSDLPFAEADVVTLSRFVKRYDSEAADRVLQGNASRAYGL